MFVPTHARCSDRCGRMARHPGACLPPRALVVDDELAELRLDLRLRSSVAVRAAYAFGDWPPAEARS